MRRQLIVSGAALALLAGTGLAALSAPAGASTPAGTLVTNGSPSTPFPQNKQNEPGLAVDPLDPQMVVAGSNDEIDLGPCQSNSCPFTPGVGVSGLYFSTDGGSSWAQPTYTGYSDRNGTPGSGNIGTVPNFYEAGLVSGGDPELAFGPQPDGHGGFTYGTTTKKVRLYYASLASNFPGTSATKGFEAVTVSHTDDLAAAAGGANSAWSSPVIESKQNAALFSDKDSITADNATSSPHFGNVYVCNVGFRGKGAGAPEPVLVGRSTDGGTSFTTQQVSAATDNNQTGGRQGCALRTTSDGRVLLVYSGYSKQLNSNVFYQQISTDAGQTFSRPTVVAVTAGIGQFDPVQGRSTIDGVAGSRTDVFPSLDVANGAPFGGKSATNEIVLAWADNRAGTPVKPNQEKAYLAYSTNGGRSYSDPAAVSDPTQGRANQPAVAIAPNGTAIYLAYNAYQDPWQSTTSTARMMNGVVRQASVTDGVPGAFTTVGTGAAGDARGSSANILAFEFLGDYNYVAATNSGAVAVLNDVRNAADCPAVDAYRQSLASGNPIAKPAPGTECLANFGNSDIYSYVMSAPTS